MVTLISNISTHSLTRALEGGQGHAPAAPYPRERTGPHSIGVWVGLRAGLNGAENVAPTSIRFPDRPARSEIKIIILIFS